VGPLGRGQTHVEERINTLTIRTFDRKTTYPAEVHVTDLPKAVFPVRSAREQTPAED
jgi:hypothetical protein